MKTLLILAGSGMGAFLDFGMGVLIASLVATIAEVELAAWQLMLGGILGVLPDLDIVLVILQRKYSAAADHHTSVMHRPIIVLPVATAAAWFLGGDMWAIITGLCLIWHFVHDSTTLSDMGIDMFWPLPPRITGYVEPPRVDLIDWLEWRWYKPTLFALTELGIGSAALFLGVYLMLGVETAAVIVALCWVGFLFVWLAPRKYKYA